MDSRKMVTFVACLVHSVFFCRYVDLIRRPIVYLVARFAGTYGDKLHVCRSLGGSCLLVVPPLGPKTDGYCLPATLLSRVW
jgi:hypothetical protein